MIYLAGISNIWRTLMPLNQGWEFAHRFFEAFARVLWAKERKSDLLLNDKPKRIAHGRSFVNSEGSESLKSLFKKEWMGEERGKQFARWHKKGEKVWKTVQNKWKIRIFRANHSHYSFLATRAIRSLKWAILSKRAKSEWAKERIPNPCSNPIHLFQFFFYDGVRV